MRLRAVHGRVHYVRAEQSRSSSCSRALGNGTCVRTVRAQYPFLRPFSILERKQVLISILFTIPISSTRQVHNPSPAVAREPFPHEPRIPNRSFFLLLFSINKTDANPSLDTETAKEPKKPSLMARPRKPQMRVGEEVADGGLRMEKYNVFGRSEMWESFVGS